jgi:sugar O-acyltransferase (sialic acid O-acetyltransferase NeuD family)
MPIDPLYIVGAGGHGKVVLDSLISSGFNRSELCLCDDDKSRVGSNLLGVKVHNSPEIFATPGVYFHVSIGNNGVRESVYHRLSELGGVAHCVTHPHATISRYAMVGEGCFIAAQAVVAPSVHLSRGSIVNHGAIVDHDCSVAEFVHIAPRAALGGGVSVGRAVFIGAGATVLPGLSIGRGAVIGAGAVVIDNVDENEVRVGVPARKR